MREEKEDGADRGGPRESQVTERARECGAKMAGLYGEERSWEKGREAQWLERLGDGVCVVGCC